MAEKKTTAGKTPATNAEKSVVDETEVRTFKSGGLPEIANVADDGPRIGHLADVAYFSGLFPGETPATLAIRILAGQSLGLDAAQALFDLETESPATIRYRPGGRTFEKANDEIETSKAAAAAAVTGMEKAVKEVVDRTTPEPASPPADAAENVVKGSFSAEKGEESSIAYQKNDNSANNGPLPSTDAGTPNVSDGSGNVENSPHSDAGQGESTPTAEAAPGSETTESALSAAKSAESVGDVSKETVDAWRLSIANMCRDLGINPDEKTGTFDAKPLHERKKYFDEVFRYYSGKIDEARKFVLARLREDGKTSIEAQKGFFLYAEVGFEPDAWTYAEAKKAEAAIAEFLKSKGTKNPAA